MESLESPFSSSATMSGPPLPVDGTGIRHDGGKRHFLAAALSALTPGAGQLFLGARRKGTFFITLFFCLCISIWPLRLLRSYIGFVAVMTGWITLYFWGSIDALVARSDSTVRPSKFWLLILVPLVGFSLGVPWGMYTVHVAGFRMFDVPSTSMEPTITKGDKIMVDTLYYKAHQPSRGDIIVFRKPGLNVVKRVIALGGDSIQGRTRQIVVNGKSLDEPYIEHTQVLGSSPELDTFGPVLVPPQNYFVMGDNRDVSLDSRYPAYGLAHSNSIVGKPLYVIRSKADRTGKRLY